MNPDFCEFDQDFGNRCKDYLNGYKCHKGDYCGKIHKFPKEDYVLCKDNVEGYCPRTPLTCWFWHSEESVKFIPDENAPPIVQSVGDLIKYLKKELVTDPSKYTSSANERAVGPQVLAKDSRLPVVGSQDKEVPPLAPCEANPGLPEDSSVV